MLEMFLGKLGWTEREFYESSPEAVYHASRGYFNKLKDESLAIRNAATIIFRALGGKEDMDRIWPIDDKGTKVFAQPDREWWEQMKIKQALVDKKIKQHGRKS